MFASVAYGQGKFVAVGGNNGAIFTSTDSTNWTSQNSGTPYYLLGVAYGHARWVAVGASGTILTSYDGESWSRRAGGASPNPLNAVGYVGGVFVAVGAKGTIRSSSDGVSWTDHVSGTMIDLRGVTYGNGAWVVTGGDIDFFYNPVRNVVLRSLDLVTWVESSTPVAGTYAVLHGVAYGAGVFVAVGWQSSFHYGFQYGEILLTSTNGASWSRLTITDESQITSDFDLLTIHYANGTFVASGLLGIYTSTNGAQWTFRGDSHPSLNVLQGAAWGDNLWVLVGGDSAVVLTSTDARNWTSQAEGNGNELADVSTEGNLMVAVGGNGTILTSTNGDRWTPQTSGTNVGIPRITFGNGRWVALARYGTTVISSNGFDWTVHPSAATPDADFGGIGFGEGKFVVVGQGGFIWTSPDGVTWTRQSSPASNYLSSVHFANDLWVAVGNYGTVVTSPDAENWTLRSIGLATVVNDVTFGNGLWVAVGWEPINESRTRKLVLCSEDGTNWVRQVVDTPTEMRGITYAQGHFVAVGAFGLGYGPPLSSYGHCCQAGILTSADGLTWTHRPVNGSGHLNGVTYWNDRFVVVGAYGAILQSEPLSEPVPRLHISKSPGNGGPNLALVGGGGWNYRVVTNTNLSEWESFINVSNAWGSVPVPMGGRTNSPQLFVQSIKVDHKRMLPGSRRLPFSCKQRSRILHPLVPAGRTNGHAARRNLCHGSEWVFFQTGRFARKTDGAFVLLYKLPEPQQMLARCQSHGNPSARRPGQRPAGSHPPDIDYL